MKKFYTCKYDRAFKEIMLKKDNIELLKYYLEYIKCRNQTNKNK